MTIRIFTSPGQATAFAQQVRNEGQTLGLVPTMGALHEGHLQLVRRAAAECDKVCVSVFVNPLQFNDASDLDRYPRDFGGDAELLGVVDCDMVFTGGLADFFPAEAERARSAGEVFTATQVEMVDPGPSAAGLEGEHRPGHFAGVATICRRLFEVVEPHRAYFGQKDFQQTLVVKHLAAQRGGPEIVVCPTVREPSGLALSSRNQRLQAEDREPALRLSRALGSAWDAWSEGERERVKLEEILEAQLGDLEVEYAVVRDPQALTELPEQLERAQALIAARVGAVRLIDNHRLDGPALGAAPDAAS